METLVRQMVLRQVQVQALRTLLQPILRLLPRPSLHLYLLLVPLRSSVSSELLAIAIAIAPPPPLLSPCSEKFLSLNLDIG